MSLNLFQFKIYVISVILLIALNQSLVKGIGCGERPLELVRSSRIVGGKDAFIGEAPWQALVKEERFFGLWRYNKCGAVLISHNWVITAAHCNSGLFGSLQVIFGEHNLKSIETIASERGLVERSPVVRKAKRVVMHPKYNHLTLENDLALIELDSDVDYDQHIQPICLPEKGNDFIDSEAYVSGWGVLSYKERTLPPVLQIVKVPIMSNKKCEKMYRKAKHNLVARKTILCAGYAFGGKDSCEGDSGGPLAVREGPDARWTLAGIVSNGIKCAEPNLPGIYTRISEYDDWIVKTVTNSHSS